MPGQPSTAGGGRHAAQAGATRMVFLAVGIGAAAWSALIPFVQLRAGLDEGQLGLLLLALGGGSLFAMPAAGALAPHLGCRVLIAAGLLSMLGTLPVLASQAAVPVLFPALMLFGAGLGTTDVAMNMQAITVERQGGRAMMSGFHGLYSLGGILGAAALSLVLGLGVTPLATAFGAAAMLALLLAAALPNLLPQGSRREGPAFAWPRGIVLLLGALCFIAFLAEGAVLDWGSVFLATRRGLDPVYGGIGYAAFSAAMTLGRLTGDRVVARHGGRRVVGWSGLVAAAGFVLVTLVPSWPLSVPAAVLGFALVGAGCANIVPVLFTAVGRQTAMPENQALPAVTTLGYAGILAGPAAIGFVAHAAGLPLAFLGVAAMLLAVTACRERLGAA